MSSCGITGEFLLVQAYLATLLLSAVVGVEHRRKSSRALKLRESCKVVSLCRISRSDGAFLEFRVR